MMNMIEKKLGEIAEILTGARLERFNDNTLPQPVFESKRLADGEELKYSLQSVSKDLNPKFYSRKNDILILLVEPKIMRLVKEDGIIIPMNYAIIRLNKGYDPRYIFYILKDKVLLRQLARLMEGSVLKIVKARELKDVKVPIINHKKQVEIGGLLEAIDKKITLKRKEIILGEKLEKSILNQLMGEE